MTQFIKLTESHVDGTHAKTIVNVAHIMTAKPSGKSKDTHIYFKDLKYIFVSETIDEIWSKLTIDNTKAPIIMSAEQAIEYYKLKDGV